jgi:hypothetical protein
MGGMASTSAWESSDIAAIGVGQYHRERDAPRFGDEMVPSRSGRLRAIAQAALRATGVTLTITG